MRTAVTVFNILSSVVSLVTVAFGWALTLVGQLSPTHTDYTAIAFGIALIAAFLIIPQVCVVASTKVGASRSPLVDLRVACPCAAYRAGDYGRA